ncbi:tRNA(adenine34) deaminase [Seinonella peptonophila]|uniref:tRNA-specific adenosine deaminase n=1 Tax=Seinonella peptonophila TaxID=112248 RepID=A0A1M4X6W3_9BACL|nr:tRNA adenosine(34) deaminase TadA [Seinonella peptonophila]SHE89187.1 tRNA(adenine34) deaminase [Seinonella peptonophila]
MDKRQPYSDEYYMDEAIQEAKKAEIIDEVPIGAVVVYQGQIIGRGHNLRETSHDPTSHAEICAIRAAAEFMGDWRLEECDIYVTLEPCPMCAGAIIQARMRTCIYGTVDPKAGCVDTLFHLLTEERFNHQTEVVRGIRQQECAELLKLFFRKLRKRKKG